MKALKIVLCVLTALSILAFSLAIYYTMFYQDTVSPQIIIDSDHINASVKDGEDVLLQGVTAHDDRSGDLTDQVRISSISQLIGTDTARINYYVFDEANNIATAARIIHYTDYEAPRFVLMDQLSYNVGEQVVLNGKVVAKDIIEGNITNYIRLSTMNLNNNAEGIYHVTLRVMNHVGDTSAVTLPVIIRNKSIEAPVVRLRNYLIYLNKGDKFDPKDYFEAAYASGYVRASADYEDVKIIGEVDTSEPGCYDVQYSYTNSRSQTGDAILTVVVQNVEAVS